MILLIFIAYLFFYISFLLNLNIYAALFAVFGWISIISIVSLIIAVSILLLIKTSDKIPGRSRFIPFLTIPVSYILARLLFHFFPIPNIFFISIVIMILSTVSIIYLMLRLKTNKFKTKLIIKKSKKKKVRKGKTNE